MNKPQDSGILAQIMCKQDEEGTKFAKLAGVTVQDKEKIAIRYNPIHKTGEMRAACRGQQKKSEDLKTWSTFKTHFTARYQDHKDENKQVRSTMFKAHQVMKDSYN